MILFSYGVLSQNCFSHFWLLMFSNLKNYELGLMLRFWSARSWASNLMPQRCVLFWSHCKIVKHTYILTSGRFAEKFGSNQQVAGQYRGRSEKMSVCYKWTGFHYIWTKESWYSLLLQNFKPLFYIVMFIIIKILKQKMLWLTKLVCCGRTWRSP